MEGPLGSCLSRRPEAQEAPPAKRTNPLCLQEPDVLLGMGLGIGVRRRGLAKLKQEIGADKAPASFVCHPVPESLALRIPGR